jgi:hypothetical protein
MNPVWIVAIPAGLVILGLILNSIPTAFDQPSSSPEQDPMKRLQADLSAYRKLFDRFRSRTLARQRYVGRYGWLVLVAIIGSGIWAYADTVEKTTMRNQIVALQTLGTEEGKEMVLSLTTSDGSNVKYLIKLPKTEAPAAAVAKDDGKETGRIEKVSTWELEKLGTLISTGESLLTVGVALKSSN